MTFPFSKTTLPAVAALVLLNCGSAHAAGGTEAVAVVNSAAVPQRTVREPATVIVAANQRETNLRKTTTFIAVMGTEAPWKR